MNARDRQHRFRVYSAFGLVYFFWGSTYLAISIAVAHIPAALLGGIRFLIGGGLALVYCALSGRKVRLSRSDAARLLLIGVLLLSGGNVLLSYSEEYVPSGLAALIVAVVPLWVALIEGFILRSERLHRRGWAGVGLGLAGLIVLLWPELRTALVPGAQARGGERAMLVACAVLLLGTLSWSAGSIVSRRSRLAMDAFTATGWEMLFAGAVNFVIAIAIGDLPRAHWSLSGMGAIAYLVVFGSWVGFTAYIWLLEHVPTSKVATYAYVNPVIAVFLGWLLHGEQLDGYILGGAAIIVVAVALVTSSKLEGHPHPAEEEVLPRCEAEA